MTEEPVLYEVRGAVAVLTLNRPAALNSFTRAMHQALWAALDRAEADAAVRALVITGAGGGGKDTHHTDHKKKKTAPRRSTHSTAR